MKRIMSLLSILLFSALLFTYCTEENEMDEMEENAAMEMDESHNTDMGVDGVSKEEWVREGEINLAEIDENGDGMVYQDPMDWNVISDEPGVCPECGMDLKEVTLEEAKRNLLENDYEVAE